VLERRRVELLTLHNLRSTLFGIAKRTLYQLS